MTIPSPGFSKRNTPTTTSTPVAARSPASQKAPSAGKPEVADSQGSPRFDQATKEAIDERVLIIGESSYPVSRFSTKYVSQVMKKHMPGKQVSLKSLSIPSIEVLYHELRYGKDPVHNDSISNQLRDRLFRGTLRAFKLDKFPPDSELPTQLADWKTSSYFSTFEALASQFLSQHGLFFWPNEQDHQNFSGTTMAEDRDLIHFLMTQVLFQSAFQKKKNNPRANVPKPAPIPPQQDGKPDASQAMVLSPMKSTQQPSSAFSTPDDAMERDQSHSHDNTLTLSPRKSQAADSSINTSPQSSPLSRKRPRASDDDGETEIHRPHASFWYRIVYSRNPYSIEIWKPRKSLHEMSLSELKADLPSEVGHSTQMLVLHLSGPNLRLKSKLDLSDEEAFIYIKGQMGMLVEPIIARYQQKGKDLVFEVEIEVVQDT